MKNKKTTLFRLLLIILLLLGLYVSNHLKLFDEYKYLVNKSEVFLSLPSMEKEQSINNKKIMNMRSSINESSIKLLTDHYQMCLANTSCNIVLVQKTIKGALLHQIQSTFERLITFLEKISSVKEKALQSLYSLQQETEENVVIEKKRLLLQAFAIGSIFIIGVNHLVIYFTRKRELSALFLSLACLVIAVRIFFIKETLFIHLFFNISAGNILLVELITGLLALLFYLLFINREFIPPKYNYIAQIFSLFIILYSVCFVIFPVELMVKSFIFYQIVAFLVLFFTIYFSFRAVRQKLSGSYLNLGGLIIFFPLVWNDVFQYSEEFSTDEFISVGLLIYLFLMSIHLSQKSSRSFDRVEKLSKELQQLNISLEVKVEKRTKELQVANESLQKVEKSRRRLLASVSHELNTPLTFIHGYIRAMMDGVVPKDDSSYLRAVYSDTQVMTQMIADLQELSRLESGQMEFVMKDMNIRSYLLQLYDEQKYFFKDKDLSCNYTEIVSLPVNKPVFCSLDAIRIKQVFKNLIVNAQKFTSSGGMISIEVEIPSIDNEREIKVNIIDTGIGIHQEDLPYVFERFYKVNDNQNPSKRGSGLGLAISKEIIEYHGGRIGVFSKLNEGSTFFFTLPLKGEKTNEKREDINS